MNLNISKRDATEIINALNSGVVPKRALEQIIVGRIAEIAQIQRDLALVSDGFSMTKFIIGPFGSGKTFFQALIQNIAQNTNFVTTKVDFSPFRKLYHGQGQAQATYTELMKNIATKNYGNENTIEMIIQEWLSKIFDTVTQEKNLTLDFTNQLFLEAVNQAIYREIDSISGSLGGSDFSQVLIKYFEGFTKSDFQLQKNAIKWICAEYTTKTEAKHDLRVGNIITDDTYYEYIKVLSNFFVIAGYSGFLVGFDECIDLYQITHSSVREKNYEMILKIFNDTLQEKTKNLYVTFSGTNEFLLDEQRGLYSYGALKTRLQVNEYENERFKDYTHPVIQIYPMTAEEMFVLLQRVHVIHQVCYDYQSAVTDSDIQGFVQTNYAYFKKGLLVTRNILKSFLSGLNILQQNPTANKNDIFKGPQEKPTSPISDQLSDRFSKFI